MLVLQHSAKKRAIPARIIKFIIITTGDEKRIKTFDPYGVAASVFP
jgi:hypothetical protein